ncbi:MAG: TIGR03619 family F420-dependent LLM class oxidoreductase [Solirubrobacteraceae bacterium]
MRFYLYGTYIPSVQLLEVSRLAEELGFAGITIPDHVVYPFETKTPYPYAADPETGRAPWDEHGEWLDPWAAAGAILAATERLEVLTGIFVLPMRDPLLVAKGASTLGALFPGRFILGVGAGWLREEFEMLGYDFDTRGPRSDEAIEVIRKLFTGERVSHEGRFFSFPDVAMQPAPDPPVRIYIGGDAPPALRRAGRLGDGILPPLSSQRKSADQIAAIQQARDEAGVTEPFDYVASAVAARDADGVMELADLGVSGVHVDPFQLYVRRFGGLSMDERRAALQRYAAEVIEPVRERCAPPS